MATKEQFEYLQQKIQQSIDTFSAKTRNNKNKTFIFKLIITLLSAISTIDLGISLTFKDASQIHKYFIQDVALVISATITVVSWLDTFYNHRHLWVSYNDAVNALRELRLKLEFKELQDGGLTANDVEELKNDYQNILNKLNNNWTKLRSAE